jgi:two-component system LytT family sensor kinase
MAVRWKRLLAVQLLVWTTYGVVHFAASIPAITPDEWIVIAVAKTVRAFAGLLLSSLLVPLLEPRIRSEEKRWWVIYGFAAIAAGFMWTLLDRAVFVTIAAALRLSIPWERFVHGMDLDYIFVMLAWTACYVSLTLFRHNSEQQKELLERRVEAQAARLNMLAAQLNPHFLFNSLNTIRSLAAEDPHRTRELITRLSSFLRRVLSFDPSVPVSLVQEIDLAKDYLAVEQARFENELEVTVDVLPAAVTIVVPHLILQPLLENAIKHGEPDADGVRRIRMGTQVTDDNLRIVVENKGTLESGPDVKGIGLALTRSRLAGMFGSDGFFHVSGHGGRVVAEIRIPLTASPSGTG